MATARGMRLCRAGHGPRIARRARRHPQGAAKPPGGLAPAAPPFNAPLLLDARAHPQPKAMSCRTGLRCWIPARRLLLEPTRQDRRGPTRPTKRSTGAAAGADLLLQHGLLRSTSRQLAGRGEAFEDQLSNGCELPRHRRDRSRPEERSGTVVGLLSGFYILPSTPTGASASIARCRAKWNW